jgi:hypothetical protein
MRRLNDMIILFSRSAPLFVLAFIVAFGSLFAVFGPIQLAFAEATNGLLPFDLQHQLTSAQISEQLPDYTELARQLYYAFSFVDFFFPFFAAIFMAAIAAFSLRYLAPQAYAWVEQRKLFPLLMLATAFDWLENICALLVISQYPTEMSAAAGLLVLAKQGKLVFVAVSQAVGWSLLLAATVKRLLRFFQGTAAGTR